jgi:hypothetical protein
MAGWVDEWVLDLLDGWLAGFVNECLVGWMYGCLCRWLWILVTGGIDGEHLQEKNDIF